MKKKNYKLSSNTQNYSAITMIPVGILSILLIVMAWFVAYDSDKYEKTFLGGQAIELSDGWKDDEGNDISLPKKFQYKSDGYSISRTINLEGRTQQNLMFSTKYLNANIYLDGEKIGSSLCRPNKDDIKTLGRVFSFFQLPQDGIDHVLRIDAQPLIGEDTQYEIVAPNIGTSGLLIYEIINNELPLLIVIAAIFCFGIFLLICGVQTMRVYAVYNELNSYRANFLQIGMFAIVFSLYSLSITDTIYLFVANSYYIYLMEFFLLALLPLPLLAQSAEVCEPRFAKFILADCWVVCLNACVQAGLHIFMDIELRNILFVTHALIIISVILIVPALTFASRPGGGRFWLPLSFSPILIGAIMDIFRYYLPGAYQKAVDFQFGVLLFLLLQTVYLIKINLLYYENNLKSKVYQQMAYSDALTGLANRAAFEEKIEDIRKNHKGYSAIWCVCADVNNLKQANDTLGHAAGDELIRGAADSLKAVALGLCEIYRTGGDEFVMLIFNQSEQEIIELKTRFIAELERHNLTHEPKLNVATGCDCFDFASNDTIEKLISRADALMYEDKRTWKQANECL